MLSASNSSLFSLSQQLLCIDRRVDLRILRHGAASARFPVLLGHELWGVPGLSGKVRVGRPLAETGPRSVARRWTGARSSAHSTRSSVRTSLSWTPLQSDQTQPEGDTQSPAQTVHNTTTAWWVKQTYWVHLKERFWVQCKLSPFRSACGSVLIGKRVTWKCIS